jgi:glutathione S-transferase
VGVAARRVIPLLSVAADLGQHYDPEHKLSYDPSKDANLYSEVLQWMTFAHGGVGPMQGQANHFFRYAPVKIDYAINRYQEETKRLYGAPGSSTPKKSD